MTRGRYPLRPYQHPSDGLPTLLLSFHVSPITVYRLSLLPARFKLPKPGQPLWLYAEGPLWSYIEFNTEDGTEPLEELDDDDLDSERPEPTPLPTSSAGLAPRILGVELCLRGFDPQHHVVAIVDSTATVLGAIELNLKRKVALVRHYKQSPIKFCSGWAHPSPDPLPA